MTGSQSPHPRNSARTDLSQPRDQKVEMIPGDFSCAATVENP